MADKPEPTRDFNQSAAGAKWIRNVLLCALLPFTLMAAASEYSYRKGAAVPAPDSLNEKQKSEIAIRTTADFARQHATHVLSQNPDADTISFSRNNPALSKAVADELAKEFARVKSAHAEKLHQLETTRMAGWLTIGIFVAAAGVFENRRRKYLNENSYKP